METRSGTSVRTALLELAPERRQAVLNSHGISEEAFALLCEGSDELFIWARTEDLARREQRFIESFEIRHATDLVGDAEVDTE